VARNLIEIICQQFARRIGAMNISKRFWLKFVVPMAVASSGLLALGSCAPIDRTPTLNEVRSGTARGRVIEDVNLSSAEIAAEVTEIDRARRELRVLTADGRRFALAYDPNTRVTYHGFEYRVDDLEAGDRIAYRPMPRDSRYLDSIRVQEPVQARAGRSIARTDPPPRRNDVVEGTVERVNYDLGVFDVRPRSGRTVTVSIPYNARAADVDNFRSLRRGDHVRVEGEFVNSESLQLLAFVSPR
jgi:hypothetical protein